MRGSLALVPCASRFAHEKCKNCLEEGDCRTRALMLQVRDRTAELLDSIRLSDRSRSNPRKNISMKLSLAPVRVKFRPDRRIPIVN
jgi:DNA-binding IscR family transcriptional regulator